jgi:2-octaprenylphenol hydroxylase
MQTTMDLLFRLFGSTFPVVGQLRNLGLNATDRVMPLKRLIMRQASGLEGDLPACARKNL